ncbi:MAG: alpha/beta hydrolase-fold protein [Polyangiaceae bacterium]
MGGAATLTIGCRKSRNETTEQEPSFTVTKLGPATTATPAASTETDAQSIEPGLAEMMFDFPSVSFGAERALVIAPRGQDAGERFPVLVALHGRGESVRGATAGARGWMDDYELGRSVARLRSPPLLREDFRGFVEDARLARLNASLLERPYRGLVVVCPWVPDILSNRDRANLDAAEPFGAFIVEELLPRVVAEAPALADRGSTGIDGVSLGGRASMLVGFAHADRFGAVGTLQAAVQDSEASAFTARARAALGKSPQRIRLLTSDRDPFAGPIGETHRAFDEGRIPHDYLVIPGPHDYAFNRGPGGIEMLLWHDRVLRGEPPL